MKKIVFILFLGFFSIGLSHAQYDIPDKPKKQTSVYDYINLLSKSEARSLEQKLIRYSDSTSTQIVVIIVNSTKGEDINYLAANWGGEWGVGQAEKDNGVILLMAKGDRKVAIQAGRGTEGRLTDLMSKRIIESRIIPEFKRESYYKGLDKGTDGVFEVLIGEFKEEKPRKRRNKTNNWDFSWFVPIVIILFIIFGLFRGGGKGGGRGGRRSTAGTLLDVIILSSLGSRGGSSGGFGSGGGGFGGGFGGGSFGGGGASGSW